MVLPTFPVSYVFHPALTKWDHLRRFISARSTRPWYFDCGWGTSKMWWLPSSPTSSSSSSSSSKFAGGLWLVGRLAPLRGLPLPCFHTKCVPIPPRALCARVSVCGGALRAAVVPNALRKGLSGGVGMRDAEWPLLHARRRLFGFSYDVDVFLLMVGSESAHSCCTVDSIRHGGTIEVRHG